MSIQGLVNKGFYFDIGHVVMLHHISSNFLLDARHYKYYSIDFLGFLVILKYILGIIIKKNKLSCQSV